jgi:fused signal recognition particle receptor
VFSFRKKSDDAAQEASWFARLRQGLRKTGSQLAGVFGGTRVDEALFEELETVLISADAGLEATQHLLERLRARARRDRLEDPQALKAALVDEITALIAPLEGAYDATAQKPFVIMIAGVNGAGKTIIGKLAKWLQNAGLSVLLAANAFAACRARAARLGKAQSRRCRRTGGRRSRAVIFAQRRPRAGIIGHRRHRGPAAPPPLELKRFVITRRLTPPLSVLSCN